MSIKGNEAQGVSVIITSDKDIEALNKLADEFQKYPVSSQRFTAENDCADISTWTKILKGIKIYIQV